MKKTTIALYIILVIAVICSAISIIQSFTKGIQVDWFAMTAIFSSLAVGFSAVDNKKKETK